MIVWLGKLTIECLLYDDEKDIEEIFIFFLSFLRGRNKL